MKFIQTLATTLLLTTLIPASAAPVIYPANGQSDEQMQQDEGACLIWARDETGFDPLASTAQTKSTNGTVLKRAAAGAIIGEIVDDDASSGAKYGAASGVLKKRRMERQAKKQSAKADELQANFQQHYAACMEGRGYVVR